MEPNLPYPGMEFTPLDILSASDMNQILANQQYLKTYSGEKQDKLIAGENISFSEDGKTISATDTKYTAGNGLTLNDKQFNVKTDITDFLTNIKSNTLNDDGTLKDSIVKSRNIDWPNIIQKTDISQLTYLQDFSRLNQLEMTFVVKSMLEGQVYTLKDIRDEKSYPISKLATGDVVFMKELRLTSGTLTPNDSDVTEEYTLPESKLDFGNSPALYVDESGEVFYNAFCYSAGEASTIEPGKPYTQSIAPKGWGLLDALQWNKMMDIANKTDDPLAEPFNFKAIGAPSGTNRGDPWGTWLAENASVYALNMLRSIANKNCQVVGIAEKNRLSNGKNWIDHGGNYTDAYVGALVRCVLKQPGGIVRKSSNF